MNIIKKTSFFAAFSLLTAINGLSVLPTTVLGSKAIASSAPSRTFTFKTLHKGDCQMLNPTLTFKSDGTGRFTAKVLTLHTHSGDSWRIRFVAKNQAGVELFQMGEWKGPRMDDGNPPPVYAFSQSFTYDPLNFNVVSRISAISSC